MKKQRNTIGVKKVKICETCSNSYSPFPYKNETSRYCSRKCYQESRKQQKQVCEECQQSFTRDRKAKYCSRKCYFKNVVPPPPRLGTGENHPSVRIRMKELGFSTYKEYEVYFLKELKLYKRRVWYYTNKQPLHLLENYDKPRTRAGTIGGYQLDHKISIKYGFTHGILAEEVGNINNLRFITWEENRKKSDQCV